ncbi:MAG: DMT family transporter [Deltaproteobacteria bacterium]|nr:DMT family transporter [Deltaproteobacteria bacterium]
MTTFFWGGTFVAGKWAVKEAPPFFVAFLRFGIASLVLWALVASSGRGSGERVPLPKDGSQWAGLFSLGLTGVFLYNFVFLTGLSWTSATNGSLIVAFNPLLTAVLSAWWLKERIRPVQAGGLLLALLGVGVVITRGSIAVIHGLSFNPGDLLMLGAPLAWALYTIIGKMVLRTFPPLVATAYASLIGTVLLLPAAALEGSLLSGLHRLTVYGWIAVLQLALLGTVVGFVWWYEGVERLGASRAAVFVNLVPLFGVLLSALILSESLAVSQLAGGILVVAGVGIGTLGGREDHSSL